MTDSSDSPLTVVVLGGGPDRERPVSLNSAAAVASALRKAGHTVIEGDVNRDDASSLDIDCDVIFPVLHGRFGEGGPLQRMMDARGRRYVGCGPKAAAIAMDKCAAKQIAEQCDVPTPPYQLLGPSTELTIEPPVVIKALSEGSSFGVWICHDDAAAIDAREQLHTHYAFGLAEAFVPGGREVTVGILDRETLPPIRIVPAVEYYDYDAKYERDDTKYEFDTGLSPEVLSRIDSYALAVFDKIGARHLGRVDFMIDAEGEPYFIEINTMPGFTDHSLVPLAAAKAGMDMPTLCDRLVRLALEA